MRTSLTDRLRLTDRPAVVGIAAAAVLAFCLAGLWAVALPPFAAVDEGAHVGYALRIADGQLPTIDTPTPSADVPGLAEWLDRQPMRRTVVWTSNHPPLAYVLLAPTAAWAATGSLAGLIAMRLTMAAALAAAVVAIGWLTRELVPSRPAAAVFAATSLALVAPLTQHSGQVLTDSVLLSAAAALLAASVRALRRGLSGRLVALVAVLAAASGLARATGMVFAGLAVGAVAVAGWRHAGVATTRSRLRGAGAPAVTVGVVTGVGAGWFYVRNVALYGDALGAGALTALHNRTPREQVWGSLLDPGIWASWIGNQLQVAADGSPAAVPVLIAAAVTPLLGFVAVWVTVRRAGGLRAVVAVVRADPGLLWAWLVLGASVAITGAAFLSWWIQGGNPHIRYVYPAVPALAAAAGAVAAGFRWRWLMLTLAAAGAASTAASIVSQTQLDDEPLVASALVGPTGVAVVTVGWAWNQAEELPAWKDQGATRNR